MIVGGRVKSDVKSDESYDGEIGGLRFEDGDRNDKTILTLVFNLLFDTQLYGESIPSLRGSMFGGSLWIAKEGVEICHLWTMCIRVCITMKRIAAREEVREHLTSLCAVRLVWCESGDKHEALGVTSIWFYAWGRFDIQQRVHG